MNFDFCFQVTGEIGKAGGWEKGKKKKKKNLLVFLDNYDK